jgi:tetratricopeptide (TPR) repeat protein
MEFRQHCLREKEKQQHINGNPTPVQRSLDTPFAGPATEMQAQTRHERAGSDEQPTIGEIIMNTRVLMAATMMAALATVPARAADPRSDDWRVCTTGVTVEQKLAACTAVLEQQNTPTLQLVGAHVRRGYLYFQSKQDADRAIQDYDEAIRLDPNSAWAFDNRGLAYVKKGQIDRALQDYDQAIRVNPKFAVAYVNRGDALRSKGRYDRAIADFDQAVALEPELISAYFGRALAYQDKAQYDFDAYLNEGRFEDRAIQDYDKVIALNPNNRNAFNNRGNVYRDKRQYDRALADYNEAVRLAPTEAIYLKNRGNLFRFTGEFDRAVADLRAALGLKADEITRKQIEISLKALGAKI